MYVRTSVAKHVDILQGNSEYILWLSIRNTLTNYTENMILGAIYLPPENSRFLNDDDLNCFEHEIIEMTSNYKYVTLAGDFNARTSGLSDFVAADPFYNDLFGIETDERAHLDKHTFLENLAYPLQRKSMDKKTNAHGMLLIDICRNNNIFILNGRAGSDSGVGTFTFRDKSVLDYVIATADCFELFGSFCIYETDPLFSDGHNALEWKLITRRGVIEQLPTCPTEIRPYWNSMLSDKFCKNIDQNKVCEIETSLSSYPQTQENIDHLTERLQNIFKEAASLSFEPPKSKHQTVYPQNKPWFGPKCHKARQNYHDAKKSYAQQKNSTNKLRLKHASKQYKRTINYYVNDYKFKQASKLRKMSTSNPKQYWKFLNNLKHKQKDNATPPLAAFYDHFKAINTDDDNDIFEFDVTLNNSNNETLDREITAEEISKCIDNLNNGKSPSPSDNILNEYLKSTKHLLLNMYTKLFNVVLNTGKMPQQWLEGYIIPIYKNKGDPMDTNNYRPITILSCLGKLFTSIINQRLTSFLEINGLLNENQAGFRKHYSCSDHIFTLYSLINILKKRKRKLYCAFIDFSQAFDKVWRFGLWRKLLQVTDGKIFKIIYNMYQNIKSCIKQKSQISNFFYSEAGVRQGENLSPVLFSIFLNDLQQHLETDNVRGIELKDHINETLWLKLLLMLYADDTIIVSDDPTDFQNCLNSFHNYCVKWKLTVNVSKTKVMVFGSRIQSNFTFDLGNTTLETTNSYHYLGVTFTSNGSFLQARKHVVTQAKKAMHLLFTRINNADLPIDLTMKLFDHTVAPILTYGSEIFGYENIDILEKVHNDFLRKLTGARKSTPLYMLYGELGRYPIAISIKSRMVSFWNRLVSGKETKLSLNIYKYMLNQNIECKWVNKIKEILENTGNSFLWTNQPFCNKPSTHKSVKQTLIDQFKQDWNAKLENSMKGKTYKSFKSEHSIENYLIKLKRHDVLPLFKFRTANHRLPVEIGRYDGTLFENRICPLCNREEVGSEKHYLLICPFFSESRSRFTNRNLYNTDFEFKRILTSERDDELIKLSRFVNTIIRHFKGV